MKPNPKLKPLFRSACWLTLAINLVGCAASAGRLERLRIGMTRAEVTNAIGKPRSSTAQAGIEELLYQFTDKPFGDGLIFPGSYYVQLRQGHVVGWRRDEVKDQLDRERAYRMNSMALAPPQRVQVNHSGYIHQNTNQNVNVSGNVNHNVNGRLNVYGY